MSNETLTLMVGGSAILALVVSGLAAVSVKRGVITRANGMQRAIMSAIFVVTISIGAFLVRGG